jgi:putative aldouronate transport system substrate-binding protein
LADWAHPPRAFRAGGALTGTGVKVECAYSGGGLGWESILRFLSFWGIVYEPDGHWLYISDDNRVDSYLRHPNFRAAMETLNRWYNEGLIDVETLTQEGNTFDAKVNSARMGTVWRMRMIAMGTPDDVVAQYTCILPVAALPGVTPQVHRYLGQVPSQGAYITAGCKDIERAARWIDAQYGFENMLNGYYGPYKEVTREGKVTQYGWRFGGNGKADFFNADVESIPNQSALQFFSDAEFMEKFNLPPQRLEVININQMYIDAGVVEKNSGAILSTLVKMPPADMIQRDLLRADIAKYAQEATAAFISKGVSNAGWNEYMATLQNLRIDEYVKLYQAAYDRYLAVLK